jgi:hypothetical protein
MHDLFLEIWEERKPVRCFETGVLMGEWFKNNTCCFHHCLEKELFPQYKYEKENIVIILPEVHEQAHNDIDKCPKIKALRKKLKEKYE